MHRDKFLESLKSKTGKGKYKRYAGMPIRYAGGKSLAVGYVIENLPDNIDKVVSPFIGGGSVELAMTNELGLKVIGYDIFGILVNYWQQQIKYPHRLANKIYEWKPTKETYKVVKDRLKLHWDNEKPIKNSIDLAAHYWFNHNLSYGPGFLGWWSYNYDKSHLVDAAIKRVRDFKAHDLTVEYADFEYSLNRHKNDFLYCDPPYMISDDSKTFKGIYPQRNFPVHHNGFKHDLLCELLKQHKGGFILSYNDCPTIREMYKDFEIKEVAWNYTMGSGETRIGKNRIEAGNTHVKKSHELLIMG